MDMPHDWLIAQADALDWLKTLADRSVDHIITDPPYSERTHRGVRSHGRRGLKGGNGKVTARVQDLGFDHLEPWQIGLLCHQFARIAKRWVLVFTDSELAPVWRSKARKAGMKVVQQCIWDRVGGAPQFDGLGPANPVEYIMAFYPTGKGVVTRGWNGGGMRGIWSHPIVANRSGHREDRIHKTQKPESLMMDLISAFTHRGELILDPFVGSGTTGAAALRLGRRFMGCERDRDTQLLALDRLRAERDNLSLQAYRKGQQPLFPKAG